MSCPRLSPRLRRAALATLGAAAALLGSEALLRAAYHSPGQYRLDPVLGLDRVPHSAVFVASEGGARLRFDRYGFNNDDAVWDRPGPRLAVLGDSFVEAAEVPREDNAVSRLAALLPGTVVLNLGRAASTPMQSVELFDRVAARERIDALLFGLSDNHIWTLAGAEQTGPDCRMPERPPSPARRLSAEVVSRSALLVRMQARARDWRENPGLPSKAPAHAEPVWSTDTALTEQLAWCLDALAARRPLAVVLMPNGELPVTEKRLAHDRDRLGFYRAAAERAGVPVLDAWAAFGADPLGDGRLVNGFPNGVLGRGHLNALGHTRLSEVLARGVPDLFPALWPVPEESGPQVAGREAP